MVTSGEINGLKKCVLISDNDSRDLVVDSAGWVEEEEDASFVIAEEMEEVVEERRNGSCGWYSSHGHHSDCGQVGTDERDTNWEEKEEAVWSHIDHGRMDGTD